MTPSRLSLLAGSCAVGVVIVAISNIATFKVARVILGLLIVFLIPGFAFVRAVLPERLLSLGEELLASVGRVLQCRRL